MCRTFQLQLKSEIRPQLLVADTMQDAWAQATEAAKHEKTKVVSLIEVFEKPKAGRK